MKALIFCCLALTATPAFAQETAHGPREISQALKAGCTVHQPLQIAGKTSYAPAIVHCNKQKVACTARQMPHLSGKTPYTPGTGSCLNQRSTTRSEAAMVTAS